MATKKKKKKSSSSSSSSSSNSSSNKNSSSSSSGGSMGTYKGVNIPKGSTDAQISKIIRDTDSKSSSNNNSSSTKKPSGSSSGGSSSSSNKSSYTGNSIVDYLSSSGKASDYNSRANLAKQSGITNYTGTAEQNTKLLNALRGSGGGSSTPSTPSAPTAPSSNKSSYTGNSIVDYLNYSGGASDYNSRANLAKQTGIANYTGTAEQNTQLLNSLRGGGTQQTGVNNAYGSNPLGFSDQPQNYTPTPVAKNQTNPYQQSSYQGSSVVDYLKTTGQSADFQSRQALATKYGIGSYTGTADQNLTLLDRLKNDRSQTMGDEGIDKPTPVFEDPKLQTMTEESKDFLLNSDYTPDQLAQWAGEAGLTFNQYLELLQASTNKDKIKEEYEIDKYEKEAFKKAPDLQELYDDAYNDAGLDNIKNKYDEKINESNKIKDDYLEALGAIDENPWLSEATRLGRGKRLADQAELKIKNILDEAELHYNEYNDGLKKVEDVVKRVSDKFSSNQATAQKQLNYLLDRVGETTKDRANSMVNLAKYGQASKTEEEPKLYGSATGGYYKYDKATGSFNMVINGKPEGGGSGSGKLSAGEKEAIAMEVMSGELSAVAGEDGYVSPSDFQKLRKEWISKGFSAKSFDENFKPYTNPTNPYYGIPLY